MKQKTELGNQPVYLFATELFLNSRYGKSLSFLLDYTSDNLITIIHVNLFPDVVENQRLPHPATTGGNCKLKRHFRLIFQSTGKHWETMETLGKGTIRTEILEQSWSCVGLFNVKLYLLKDIKCKTFISIGGLWRLI